MSPPMHEGKIETPSRAPGPRRGFPLLGFRRWLPFPLVRKEVPRGTFCRLAALPRLTLPMGNDPMSKNDKSEKIALTALFFRAGVITARMLGVAERWIRPVDQFDYVVRRRLIPVPSREQPAPLKKNLVQRNGLSNDVQHAIGQRLRAEYALDRSLPSRIARLLSEFEQRNGTEAIAST